MNREEFMIKIQDCEIPLSFDQQLLDRASEMFGRWGKSWHSDEKEHLFKTFGMDDHTGDTSELKREKKALRCILSRMMSMQISSFDAAVIIKNFNRINDPNFKLSF